MSSNSGGMISPRLMAESEYLARLGSTLGRFNADNFPLSSRLWHNVTVMLMHFAGRADTGPYLVDLFQK